MQQAFPIPRPAVPLLRGTGGLDYFSRNREQIQLHPILLGGSDVEDFFQGCERVLQTSDSHQALGAFQPLLTYPIDDYLPGCVHAWAERHRSQLQQALAKAREYCVRLCQQEGNRSGEQLLDHQR